MAALMVASAAGQVDVPAQEAASAVAYQPRALQASAASLGGKLIKLQFLCRGAVTETHADGGLRAEVVDSPRTRIKADVEVPKEAVAWFMSLPTPADYKGGPAFTVYARLETDKFGAPVARLLGREYRSDAGGSRIEW
jgi:hypothetical protein